MSAQTNSTPPLCLPSMRAAAVAIKLGLAGEVEARRAAVANLGRLARAWYDYEVGRKGLSRWLPSEAECA